MSSVLQIISKLWPASIRGQLILGIALVHLFLMTIFVFDLVGRQREFLKKQNLEQVTNFVNVFAVNATTYIIANDFDQLERFVLYHSNFPNLRYAMILSPDRIVLAHTNKTYIAKKPVDDISLQLAGLTTGKTLLENDDILDIAVPIFADKKMVGWARVAVGQDYIQNNMTSIVRSGIVYILVALLIGILVAILISNRLTAGLYKLISTVEKIESGDRDVRATSFRSRELLNLGTAFNQMLDEISAQERERQQISMELHDNVKQLMAGCLLNIDFMKMIVKDEKASTAIDNIKKYLREAIEELRRISHQLAPSIDASISLEEKIKTVVSTMNVAKTIEIRYQFDEFQEAIKAEVQLAMYRIIQEQFTNILKHANASLVEIIVQRRNGDICMSIEDNGVGFDTHSTKNGIGLENIKRRVQVFNGSFSIQALAGKGCKLDVQFPVD